ncbi:hypothetical protein ACFWOG_33850 [Kitasatospora sp. NPDC058406]|uniref:hypothetical protein n=1 Tax=Streptomycetaceae TaxID=2062 RepID=UPI002E7A4FA0|nr:hypothetical protein [Streptomyces sp. BE303]MED7948375.1 hypothetical protein [Streptomyces sp. BE303]
MAGRKSGAQIWGAAVVVGSALAVVAAYLINGAALVLAVAGVEVLLLMVYVGLRWQLLHRAAEPGGRPPARGHRTAGGSPDAAHCERCRRAREAIDARQAERLRRTLPGPGREPAAPGRPVRERRSYERSAGHHRPVRGSQPPHDARGAHDPRGVHDPRGSHGPDARGPESRGHESRGHETAVTHDRPVREWTAERAAARSADRPTARHGAPGSAGRAVGRQ